MNIMPHLINAITKQPELVIHTDGGSRGNPGPSAIGVVINTPDGKHLESFGKYIGETTNNQAEYRAVIEAFKAIKKYQPQRLQFFLDSELVVKQLNGVYRMKNPDLTPLFHEIKSLSADYEVSFEHVLRIKNHLADIEVNKALDEVASSSAK
jgi:ribonuclease HI